MRPVHQTFSSAPSAPQLASAPARVQDHIVVLMEALDSLNRRVEALNERLAPVMVPMVPPPAGATGLAPVPSCSPMVDQLGTVTTLVRCLDDEVCVILERLQL